MSLDLTPVHRNLHTKVTFLGLEFEDLILVLALAAVMNIFGTSSPECEGPGDALSLFMEFIVPLLAVPFSDSVQVWQAARLFDGHYQSLIARTPGAHLSEIRVGAALHHGSRGIDRCGYRSKRTTMERWFSIWMEKPHGPFLRASSLRQSSTKTLLRSPRSQRKD